MTRYESAHFFVINANQISQVEQQGQCREGPGNERLQDFHSNTNDSDSCSTNSIFTGFTSTSENNKLPTTGEPDSHDEFSEGDFESNNDFEVDIPIRKQYAL